MEYEVIISERARFMMKYNVAFLAKISKSSAKNLRQRFYKAFKSLEKMPERNPFVLDGVLAENQYRKLFVDNWFLVIYKICDDRVFVDYIVDCRQDYNWL